MPLCIRDSVLTRIPKGNKNTSCSQNYRAIALASALRRMLSICVSYATSHGLVFNVDKTQLICFHSLCKE